MKDIFAEFYNKVIGFFRRTEEVEESSKDVARNRLRVVLMQDRTNLTPELMEKMRKELVDLLSKYVEMDKEALELNLEQEGEQIALMLSIPVLRAKDESEIEEALSEDEKEEEISEQDENIEEDEASEENTSEEEQEEEDLNAEEDEAAEETEDDIEESSTPEDEFENDACDCGKCEKCNPKKKK